MRVRAWKFDIQVQAGSKREASKREIIRECQRKERERDAWIIDEGTNCMTNRISIPKPESLMRTLKSYQKLLLSDKHNCPEKLKDIVEP